LLVVVGFQYSQKCMLRRDANVRIELLVKTFVASGLLVWDIARQQ
jgi:hypothetical protein